MSYEDYQDIMDGYETPAVVRARERDRETVARKDRYTIEIQGVAVRATEDQERRIREMTAEQRERFIRIMGGESR